MTPEVLREVALEVANSRTLQQALDAVVVGLARSGQVALARIWLLGPGDRCAGCAQADVCNDKSQCLHLSASEGRSLASDSKGTSGMWNRLDGDFCRLPLNDARKVGYAAKHALPVLIPDIGKEQRWVARPQWVVEEGLASFAAQPVIAGGQTLGVLGLFSRSALGQRELGWLRTFADRIAVSISNARAFDEIAALRQSLEEERDYLRVEVKEAHRFGDIVGSSPRLMEVLEQVELVAPTDSAVLLQGESGTGKELIAVAVHERSSRKDKPLVRVNCASIPRELFESEFFGHVKGSFSGAIRDRVGRFELARGGTLFLDEVGEIPLELQSKLLRVLQEGTFERVGDERTRRVDVRIVAATNRDLQTQVTEGSFRADLYYRLSVFPLVLPPLRERREDIGVLAQHFLHSTTKRLKRKPMKISVAQVQLLESYDWPGNIRELQNALERAVILARSNRIQLEGLAHAASAKHRFTRPASLSNGSPPDASRPIEVLTDAEMQALERANLLAALKRVGGRVSGDDGAASLLGIKPSTLASRIKKFQISRSEYQD